MFYRWNRNPNSYNRFEKGSELETVEFQIRNLKDKFGNNFDHPKLEDFGLDSFLVDFVEKYNFDVKKYNEGRERVINNFSIALVILTYMCGLVLTFQYSSTEGTAVVMFYSLFLIYPIKSLFFELLKKVTFSKSKKEHELSNKYYAYLEKKNFYPGKIEINKLLEKLIFLREQKRQKDYWYSLSGHEFEEEMTRLFKKYNYKDVVKTKGSGDGGVDIIITKHEGDKIFVQCKAHKKPAGPHTVRDLFGAMTSGGVNQGLLISLAGVTTGARDFIKDKNIKVLDIDGIIKMNIN